MIHQHHIDKSFYIVYNCTSILYGTLLNKYKISLVENADIHINILKIGFINYCEVAYEQNI